MLLSEVWMKNFERLNWLQEAYQQWEAFPDQIGPRA